MTKKCSRCKVEKDISEFGKLKRNKDGLACACKVCMQPIYRANSKKHYKQYIQNGGHSYTKYRKKHYEKYKHSLKKRYYLYKQNAIRRSFKFDLTEEQFNIITKQPCFYCGLYNANQNFCGIDRKDNTLGYSIDNCKSCCTLCNFMKHTLSLSDFINHIKRISDWKLNKTNT